LVLHGHRFNLNFPSILIATVKSDPITYIYVGILRLYTYTSTISTTGSIKVLEFDKLEHIPSCPIIQMVETLFVGRYKWLSDPNPPALSHDIAHPLPNHLAPTIGLYYVKNMGI